MYCASKFGLAGLSESLRAPMAGRGVRVVDIAPGPVPTPGFPHASLVGRPVARPLWTTPEKVARACARAGIGRGPDRVIVPRIWTIGLLVKALLPSVYRRVTGRVRGRATTPSV
jgi:short-subunit dehydrogenase